MNNAAYNAGRTDSKSRGADAALTGALCYFLFAALTIHLTSDGRSHATMWPADAVILALLLQNARRDWTMILAAGWMANLAANAVTRGWSWGVVPYGAINMGSTWIAALMLTRKGRVDNLLHDLPTVMLFIASAGMVGPILGALAGTTVSVLNYDEAFGPQFLRWFGSNALGNLIVTPCLISLFDGSYAHYFRKMPMRERLEVLVLNLSHAATTWAVFGIARVPLLFLPITTLTILAFRTGRLGIQIGIVTLTLIGTSETFLGKGPLNMIAGPQELRDFYFQIYVAVMLLTVLPIGAAISKQTQAQQLVAERGEALKLMLGHSPDVILGFDGAGTCRWVEGPIERLMGIAPETVLGRSTEIICLLAPPALAGLLSGIGDPDHAGERVEFSPLLRRDLTLEASCSTIERTAEVSGAVVVLHDVTERKAGERAIRTEAQTDDVTGVLTRPSFRRTASSAARGRQAPSSLALIEVDHFKSISDTYGYEIGNDVLAEVARQIAAHLREADIIGRIGHDEFAILFECDLPTARMICERLIEAIRINPVYTRDTVSIIASISCGLTRWDQTVGLDDAFETADRALREIKRTGRNGILIAA